MICPIDMSEIMKISANINTAKYSSFYFLFVNRLKIFAFKQERCVIHQASTQ